MASKNADPAAYRAATGVEAMFGYLYLSGQNERIRKLFERIFD
jgi:ribonuclease-3 family protein